MSPRPRLRLTGGPALPLLLLLLVSAGCTGKATPGRQSPAVTAHGSEPTASATVISDPSTRDISVWTPPDTVGGWPIVYAVTGASGDRNDLAVLARRLATHGYLVFATDHREIEGPDDIGPATHDIECGYRYVLSVAQDFGGDLEGPITMVGHSFGAGAVVYHGLHSDLVFGGPSGTFDDCATPDRRPDVIVAIAGCYYGLPGQPSDWDTSGLSNRPAHVVLIAGTADATCPADQSERAAATLTSIGDDANLVEVDGATHATLIFQEDFNPDMPAGGEVVQAIVTAIDAARH